MSQPAISSPYIAPRTSRPASFVGHAKVISILTLVSRILGMARESVFASYFGASGAAQAFTYAFSIPNLFRKLLGEGALSAAFIPLYAQALKAGEKSAADRFAAASVNLLGMILIALAVVGELILWLLTHLVQFRPDNLLVVHLTAVMLPYVLLVCGTAFLSGILQVHKRFAIPALTQVPLNLIHIAVIVIGAKFLLLRPGHPDEALQIRLAYWLSGFVLVAGALQIAMLVPSLRAIGFRPMWVGDFGTPAVRKMLSLSMPIALSAGVLQLSVVLDKSITLWLTAGADGAGKLHFFHFNAAYPVAFGALARLNWAQMLYQFPLGVLAIAVATAIFPNLSAEALDKNREKFNGVLRQGIIFTLLEGLPASAGLILVRYPAVRLLFQHGSFTPDDTRWVALSLLFYSAAIWAFSLQQILNRAYYALHDTRTPMVMAIVTIALNTIVEVPLCFTRLGEAGMAVGTLVSFAVQAVVMLLMLDRKVGGIGMKSIVAAGARMLVASGLMIVACLGVQNLSIYPRGDGHLASLAQLLILICVGGAVYGAACWGLGVRKSLKAGH